MTLLCYHASQEQFSPSQLLSWVQKAEACGFQGIHSSDHFHPWSSRQGKSGFTFSWIAAAMQSTSLPFSMVCAPGQRYHPAIVAQAIATLAEMFPGRINFELGSGEAINECITGTGWPPKDERNKRLLESVDVIRRLLRGEKVSHAGSVVVRDAKLYTLPSKMPLLLCAAMSENTSKWAGSWADGLLTTGGDRDPVQQKMKFFAQNGGKDKPVYLQYSFAFAATKRQAVEEAWQQWRSNMVGEDMLRDTSNTEDFDKASEHITMEQVASQMPVFTKPEQVYEHIHAGIELGVDRIIMHNVCAGHDHFIERFGAFIKTLS